MVSEFAPDVVILDLSIPVMSGLDVAEVIRRRIPSTKIIFLTKHHVPVTAREVGANAFVKKTELAQSLVAAVERVIGESRKSSAARVP